MHCHLFSDNSNLSPALSDVKWRRPVKNSPECLFVVNVRVSTWRDHLTITAFSWEERLRPVRVNNTAEYIRHCALLYTRNVSAVGRQRSDRRYSDQPWVWSSHVLIKDIAVNISLLFILLASKCFFSGWQTRIMFNKTLFTSRPSSVGENESTIFGIFNLESSSPPEISVGLDL